MMNCARVAMVGMVKMFRYGYHFRVSQSTSFDDSHGLPGFRNNLKIKIMMLMAQENKVNPSPLLILCMVLGKLSSLSPSIYSFTK